MRYEIRIAGKDTWLHDEVEHGPLTVERAIAIAAQSPDETIIYRDGLPHMRFKPKSGGSLIALERHTH